MKFVSTLLNLLLFLETSAYRDDQLPNYEKNTITIKGNGIYSVKADGFDVDIRISVEHLNVTEGKAKLGASLDHILHDNVPIINNENFKVIPGRFSISRNYVYENHTNVPRGYSLTQELKVKTFSVETLSLLIEKVVTTENCFVGDTRPFVHDHAKMETIALRNALFDANAKAQTLAQAAGGQALGPFQITTSDTESSPWEKSHASRSSAVYSEGFSEAWAASVVTFTQSLIAKYHLVPALVLSA